MGGSGTRGPSTDAAATHEARPGSPAIILAAAERGAGKSTAFAMAAARVAALGWEPRGIVCPGIYLDGHKAAVLCRIMLPDGSAGEAWELAQGLPDYDSVGAAGTPRQGTDRGPSPGSPGGPRPVMLDAGRFSYGKWEFSLDGLRQADAACVDALAGAARGRIVFIDEIGPLELSFGLGLTGTLAAIDGLAAASPARGAEPAGRRVAAAVEEAPAAIVVAVRPELAGSLAERWPGSRTVRAAAAAMAAEGLAAELVAALRNALGRAP